MRSITWGVGAVTLAAAAGLSSCGSGTATTATTAIKVSATNYVTIAPTPSTDAPVTSEGGLQPEQQYTILSGDYAIGVAKKFHVKLDDLLSLNGWAIDTISTDWPPVGSVIKIPAGGTLPDQVLPTTPGSGTAKQGTATTKPSAKTTTTLKGGQSNCPAGSYVILKGDYPGLVAKKFDTTVTDLAAVNASTKGYSSFAEGTTIVIPAKKC
jgi:peptidoglycan endopeptidase LytE